MDFSPLWISLKIAVCSTVITFAAGLLAAWGVTCLRRGRHIVDGILSVPLVLPPTVVGFLLLVLFGKSTALGRFLISRGLNLIFTWQGAVIAAFVISFPVMYRGARGAIEQVDDNLIHAARTLGMGEFTILRKVILPSAWPGIAAAAVLSFARALGEFGATIMIAGNLPGKTQTMSVAVYTAMQGGNRQLAFRWVLIIVVFSLAILILMNYQAGRGFAKHSGNSKGGRHATRS
ncbi:MAG: molybdate ABC transporter permease subunit [Lachnospiraceae bacterium]|nr:molybdate ABC transporter permease subunit [Lachnospiraceae bacterium]